MVQTSPKNRHVAKHDESGEEKSSGLIVDWFGIDAFACLSDVRTMVDFDRLAFFWAGGRGIGSILNLFFKSPLQRSHCP